jgi:hypothetical protein
MFIQQYLHISPGSIYRDINAILKINPAPVFLSIILRSISSKNSAYQARADMQISKFSLELFK